MNSNKFPEFITCVGDKEYACEPLCRQEYATGYFETGLCGHPKDTMYLLLCRNGEETMILLRPDEAQGIAVLLNGLAWASAINGEDM